MLLEILLMAMCVAALALFIVLDRPAGSDFRPGFLLHFGLAAGAALCGLLVWPWVRHAGDVMLAGLVLSLAAGPAIMWVVGCERREKRVSAAPVADIATVTGALLSGFAVATMDVNAVIFAVLACVAGAIFKERTGVDAATKVATPAAPARCVDFSRSVPDVHERFAADASPELELARERMRLLGVRIKREIEARRHHALRAQPAMQAAAQLRPARTFDQLRRARGQGRVRTVAGASRSGPAGARRLP